MACLPRWGASGVHHGADIVMSAGDKRRGGSKAVTPTKPQQPKPTKKGAPVVKRP